MFCYNDVFLTPFGSVRRPSNSFKNCFVQNCVANVVGAHIKESTRSVALLNRVFHPGSPALPPTPSQVFRYVRSNLFIPLHPFRFFLGPIFLHTPNLVVYCLLITIALDRLAHTTGSIVHTTGSIVACVSSVYDCHKTLDRFSHTTGSIVD